MNIARHFETYRASLKVDALDGCIDYARAVPTAKPQEYPTVYDYLYFALDRTSAYCQANDASNYAAWVQRHQKAMVALFERMVGEVLWDYVNTTPQSIYDLVQEHGWRWFKFCKKSLEMTVTVPLDGADRKLLLVWVPRYVAQFEHLWKPTDRVAMDADELSWFLAKGMTPQDTHPILRFKLDNPGVKFLKVEDGRVLHKPILKINEGDEVLDWSMPLF